MTPRGSRGAAAAVLVVLAGATLAACGGHEGGDTRCEDFALMSADQRADVVEELLAEKSGSEPTEGTIQLTVTAASYHCLAPEAADDIVRDVLG